jgi:hypothetical protein
MVCQICVDREARSFLSTEKLEAAIIWQKKSERKGKERALSQRQTRVVACGAQIS